MNRLLTLLILALLGGPLLQGCATTEELYAQYDERLCRVATPVGVTMATASAVSGAPWYISVYFGLDEDELEEEEARLLGVNLQTLKEHPGLRVLVRGFTDSIASDKYNLALSERRVAHVVGYLEGNGLHTSRITIQPHFGEDFPVEPNVTEDRRAVNRRVEMLLLDEDGRIVPVEFDANRQPEA